MSSREAQFGSAVVEGSEEDDKLEVVGDSVERHGEQQEYDKEAWENLKEEYGVAVGRIITGLDKDGKKVRPRVLKIDEENGRIIYDTAEGKVKDFPIQDLIKASEMGRLLVEQDSEGDVEDSKSEGTETVGTAQQYEEVVRVARERKQVEAKQQQQEAQERSLQDVDVTDKGLLALLDSGEWSVDVLINEVGKLNPNLGQELQQELDNISQGKGSNTSLQEFLRGRIEEAELEAESGPVLEAEQVETMMQSEGLEGQGQVVKEDGSVQRAAERARGMTEQQVTLQQEAEKRRQEVAQAGRQQFTAQGPRLQQRMVAERARKQAQEVELGAARGQAGRGLGLEAERLARRASQAAAGRRMQPERRAEGGGSNQSERKVVSTSEQSAQEQGEEVAAETAAEGVGREGNEIIEDSSERSEVIQEEQGEQKEVEGSQVDDASEGNELRDVAEEIVEEDSEVAAKAEQVAKRLEEGVKLDDIILELKSIDPADPVLAQIEKSLQLSELDRSSYGGKMNDVLLGLEILADRERRKIQKRRSAGGASVGI